ncbi:MAG: hypothetical protein FWB75_07485 [Oscillospiraceae bacterium]|nr:hypothetical protein [Oscillospiraceae bacterium]
MEEKKKAAKFLLEVVTQVFAFATLGVTLSGWLMENLGINEAARIADGTGIFRAGANGMPYESLFQLFGLSVVLGVLLLIFISDMFLTKIMLLWRYAIFLALAIIAISAFAIVFTWFPVNLWQGFAAMLGMFVVASTCSMVPALIKTRREDKQLEKSLSDYKSKRDKS